MSNENSAVYNHYLELSKPTKEDLERGFSEDELKLLCLKHKCRVDMWRWNIVDDYRLEFTKSGRYQRWSEPERLGMLAKAVNKMKPKVLYNEEEILNVKKEQWHFRLKDNILSLKLWERERLRKEKHPEELNNRVMVLEAEDPEEAVVEIGISTESMNANDLLTQPCVTIPCENVEIDVDIESIDAIGDGQQSQIQDSISTEINVRIFNKSFEDDSEESDFSSDSLDTVLFNHSLEDKVVKPLQSQEVAPAIANIYNVNTISMSIDSQIADSEALAVLQSQDVIPASYDNFEILIPATSTQSQEIIDGKK